MVGKDCFLDTNIIVPFLNGDAVIAQKVGGLEAINLPITVLGELYYGAMKSTRPQENLENILGFARQCNIYPIDEEAALSYGKLKSVLAKQDTPIPENDIWIAALAKSYHFPIVTRDRHFANVPGIEVIAW